MSSRFCLYHDISLHSLLAYHCNLIIEKGPFKQPQISKFCNSAIKWGFPLEKFPKKKNLDLSYKTHLNLVVLEGEILYSCKNG